MEHQVIKQDKMLSIQTGRVTALQMMEHSGELLQIIRNRGGWSATELALPYLLKSMQSAMSDHFLSSIKWDKASVDKIIYLTATQGTKEERAALGRHLSVETGYSFPPMSEAMKSPEGSEIAIKMISDNLIMLAEHYGFKLTGDLRSIAYTMLYDYGGLSAADFLVFFEKCKGGKYRQEFQHGAVRGINYEFVRVWLESYVDERTEAFEAMYRSYKDPIGSPASDVDERTMGIIAKMVTDRRVEERKLAGREVLEFDAEKLRLSWKKELYETVMFKTWYKKVRVKREFVVQPLEGDSYTEKRMVLVDLMCDENDKEKQFFIEAPLERLRAGATERLLKRAIYEYVAFGSYEKTVEIFDEIKDANWKKFAGEEHAKGMVDAEYRIILSQVSSFMKNTNPETLVGVALKTLHPDITDRELSMGKGQYTAHFKQIYYDEYLPKFIKAKKPPLSKKDYIFSECLFQYVQAGHPNPINKIIL